MALSADFDRNVFINCPFDDRYKPMFEAMVFAVMECGFIPRCALEVSNSAQVRMDKLFDVIADCRLAVHDISDTDLDKANNLPRFNIPFELGVFLGCKRYGQRAQRRKTCLVLDREKYRYQKFLSDIGGQDIADHDSKFEQVISKVRDWLQGYSVATPLPGGAAICARYEKFRAALPAICAGLELEQAKLTFKDLVVTIETYLVTS